jgi:hypothetical protein
MRFAVSRSAGALYGEAAVKRFVRRLLRDERGQMAVEYSLVTWLFVFFGTASLAWFLMALEEAAIDYYQDVVSVVCLPIP